MPINALIATGGGYRPPAFDYGQSKQQGLQNQLMQQQIEAQPFQRQLDDKARALRDLALDAKERAIGEAQKSRGDPISIDIPDGTLKGYADNLIKFFDMTAEYPDQAIQGDQFDPEYLRMMAELGIGFTMREQKQEKDPDAIRTLKAMQEDPSLLETDLARRSAGAQQVSIDARQMGTIPPGFKAVYDEQNRIVRLEAIPGGPAEIEAEEKAKKAAAGLAVKGTAAQTVWEDAERSLAVIDKYGKAATGLAAKTTKHIPGTPAHQLTKHIESIQGNIGIDQLLKIKESGAGLGHIPQAQLEMLASLLGKLDPEMAEDDLRYNLLRIQEIYSDIVKLSGGDPKELYRERIKRIGGEKDPWQVGSVYEDAQGRRMKYLGGGKWGQP